MSLAPSTPFFFAGATRYVPLTFYIITEVISIIVHVVLLYGYGFKSFEHHECTYYTYNMPTRPVVSPAKVGTSPAAAAAGSAAGVLPNRKLSSMIPIVGGVISNIARTVAQSTAEDVGPESSKGAPQSKLPLSDACRTAVPQGGRQHWTNGFINGHGASEHNASVPQGEEKREKVTAARRTSTSIELVHAAMSESVESAQRAKFEREEDVLIAGSAGASAHDIINAAMSEKEKALSADAALQRAAQLGHKGSQASAAQAAVARQIELVNEEGDEKIPILFLHGLVGILPYMDFIANLAALGKFNFILLTPAALAL